MQDITQTTDKQGLRSRKTAILIVDIADTTGIFSTLVNKKALIKIADTLSRITGIDAVISDVRIKTIDDATVIDSRVR